MELNDLKSAWNNVEGTSRSEADLQKMTRIVNHPSLKKIRTKFIIEIIGLTMFLFIYKDGFDGDKKPLYVNALLVSSIILYIFNNVLSYVSIAGPIRGANLKISIQNYLLRIKRLSVFSLIISFLYGISLIIFFTSIIRFSHEKILFLACIIIVLLLMTYFSFRVWNRWIKSLKLHVKDFNTNEI